MSDHIRRNKKTKSFEVVGYSAGDQLTVELIDQEARKRGITPSEYILQKMKKELVDED